MAGAAYSEIKSFVETVIQRSDLTTYVTEAINEAILDITLLIRPHEMHSLGTITTSTGVDTYNLASDVLAIQNVVIIDADGDDNPVDLNRGAVHSWQKRPRDTTNDVGLPKKYLRRGNTVEFYDQIPDDNGGDNYTVEYTYIKRPTKLSNSSPSTTSDLNAEWDLPTKYLAAFRMFVTVQDFEKAQAMLSFFQDLVKMRQTPKMLENEFDNESVGYME